MKDLENKLNYRFSNPKLLETALTHTSYAREKGKSYEFNNERLEFLGDAYLDAIIGHKLFKIMSTSEEGVLSKRRSAVVCEESLADVARQIGLGRHLRLGKGELQGGGADKSSILADALEAVIGAIVIDGGFYECERVVNRLLGDKVRMSVRGQLNSDYKSELQEILQARFKSDVRIVYEVIKEEGPAHDKSFEVEVSSRGIVIGRGKGRSKLRAEQEAAHDAIDKGVEGVL